MRIVFDTNVILATFITHGASAEVFEHCLTQHQIISSAFILEEVEDKLLKKFKFTANKVGDLIRFLRSETETVDPIGLSRRVCRDTDDDKILATTLAAHADCILTGDNDLLDLKEYEGIFMLKVADFWKFERSSKG